MEWQEALYRWEEYAEKLYPLRDKVAEIFEIHYIWNEGCNCREKLYEADEDTLFLLKFSEKLNEICEFIKSHIGVLEQRVSIEEEQRANLEQVFESWKRGLCPKLMKTVPRWINHNSLGFSDYWETYDEVAKFLNSETISYSATKKAIEAWETSQKKLKLTA